MTVFTKESDAWSYVLEEPVSILVADDDPILREFASVHLSTPSATVVTAPEGKSALELLRASPFDIAVLDIEMPVMDGFALLECIRADDAISTLPVMMLTGHEDIRSIDRAFKFGANAFAPKPVNWRLLSYQIRYLLRTCSLERELRARRAAGQAVKHSLAEHKLLRNQCEAILAEARSSLEHIGELASNPEQASLQRIERLAGQILEGDVFDKQTSIGNTFRTADTLNESRKNNAA